MSIYVGLHLWPQLTNNFGRLNGFSRDMPFKVVMEIFLALRRSAVQLSTRGLVLVYLFISSVSVEIGLSVLLWQQLCYIYEGKTYLSHLSSQGNDEVGKKDCQNLFRFFGCPYSISRYLPNFWRSRKKHKRWEGGMYISENQCHAVTVYYLFLGCEGWGWGWGFGYLWDETTASIPLVCMKTFVAFSFHGAVVFIHIHVTIANLFNIYGYPCCHCYYI